MSTKVDQQTPAHAAQSRAERILSTLAAYIDSYGCDSGGGHLRTAMRAALIADQHGTAPAEAIDLAEYDSYDDRVRSAGAEMDRLLGEAHEAWLAAEYGETPAQVTR